MCLYQLNMSTIASMKEWVPAAAGVDLGLTRGGGLYGYINI